MHPVEGNSSFFSCFDSRSSEELDELERALRDSLYLRFQQPEERALIGLRWADIRDQACANAGLKFWGEHVLAYQESLKSEMDTVIEALDTRGYRPWPRENHENRVSQMLEHTFYPNSSIPEFTWNEIKALFFQPDPALWVEARRQVEAVFPRLLEQIESEDHPDKVTEVLVDHIIGVYAYMQPEDGAAVQLLQMIDDKWQLVTYRIEKIQLTDPTLTGPAFAFGLTPIDNAKANPVLIYKGTTNPTDEGALLGYMADLTPFHSVGELIYKQGREAIHAFVNRTDKQVNVYGLSLGGAMAILTGEDLPEKTIIHAHAAPGKLPFSLTSLNGENVYNEHDACVPTLGFFHPDVRLYRTLTTEDPEMTRNLFRAHVLPPAGCAPTIILRVNTQYENEKLFRKVWTVFQQVVSIVLFTAMTAFILARYAFNQTIEMIAARLSPPVDQVPKVVV